MPPLAVYPITPPLRKQRGGPWLTAIPPRVQTPGMSAGLPPRLAAVRDELESSAAHARRIVDRVDDGSWGRRPAAAQWSVAECLQHLNMTSHAMIPLLRDAVRVGRERGWTRPSQRMDLVGWLLTRSLESTGRARFKTTERFTPASIESRDAVLREFESLQTELIALLADLGGLTTTKLKITSAFNPRIRYNAYSALRVTTAHQRRHLRQAERALAAIADQQR